MVATSTFNAAPMITQLPSAALALSALVQGPQPQILAEAPEGWRFERIDFPLPFAPDIAWQGFEELRFAPGMFDAESHQYFSYVLALRLDTSPAIGAPQLHDFLTLYYTGLCGAVAQQAGHAFKPEELRVDVQVNDDGLFAATIDMIDPFVTGEALMLGLELSVHPSAQGTEVFGIASPAARDAQAWKELDAFRAAWLARRPVNVNLNHVFLVPDAETYAALRENEFLTSDFGVFEERTTQRADMSYRGLYFYAADTYFEFLDPASTDRFKPGDSGIAFGIEEAGGSVKFARQLKARGLQTFIGPMQRTLGETLVPWFQIMGLEKPHLESRLSLFSMEYDPRFLAGWHAELTPRGTSIQRAAVIERYAAQLGQDERQADARFKRIRAVLLEVDEREFERFLAYVRVSGYRIEATEAAAQAWGQDIRFDLARTEAPRGVVGLEFELRPGADVNLDIGRVSLRLEGEQGRLLLKR